MSFREEIQKFWALGTGRPLALGMGCATIGQGGDAETQARFQATLEAAYASGLRYFDTSAQYGGSEFRLGQFLRRLNAEERCRVFVATKSPIPNSLTPQEAALYVKQGIHNSLERLHVETIDLFQIHDVERLDQVLAHGGALEILLEARQAGQIRYFGLATRWHDLLETAVLHGEFDTILTYLDFSPLNQSAAPLIALAAQRGVGVINGSPLAFGLLTGQDPRRTDYSGGEFRQMKGLAVKLYDYCKAQGVSLLALALQYPLGNPGINMTLTGPASPQELQEALSASQMEIPPEVRQELRDLFCIPIP